MEYENIFNDLKDRKTFSDTTDEENLKEHLSNPRAIYCGFDPTASSLHIGSLVPIIILKRFQLYGHRPILLIGGGTGLIGDPAGKAKERTLSGVELVKERAEQLKSQVSRFLDFSDSQQGAIIVDNYDWISKIDLVQYLREYGKHFSLKELLDNRYVKSRLDNPNAGISYAEFSYTLLQAIDFVELFDRYQCTIQIGGSDQWGNITNGTRLARALERSETLHGFTLPLLLQEDGITKFGKSEEGTNVWLDEQLTPIYDFYQYWFKSSDDMVENLMLTFSLRPVSELQTVIKDNHKAPEKRIAQRELAYEMTKFVHGEQAALACKALGQILFPQSGTEITFTVDEISALFNSRIVPTASFKVGETDNLVSILDRMGLTSSKKEAKRLIASGSIKINGNQKPETDLPLGDIPSMEGGFVVIQKGKTCGILKVA